ncbi:MAG: AAA family ATPase [archaeon]
MIIKKIKLHNIRSYNSAEIVFPKGSSLLSGDIGSGKTSVLLAIEFALFGLQPGQKGASLLRSNEKEGEVVLELEIEGKEVIIERGLKRGKTVSQSYASITLNGKKEESSVTEVKNKVLALLEYPPEFTKKTNILYKFTVYTPQEEMKQIILEDAETRLNTLRHIFGIDKFKRIKENSSFLASKLRESIRNKEGLIEDLENIKQKLADKKANSESFAYLILEAEVKVQDSTNRVKSIQAELEKIEEKIEEKRKFENEIEKAKIRLSSKREMKLSLEKEKSQLQGQIDEIKKIEFSESKLQVLEEEKVYLDNQFPEKDKLRVEILSKITSFKSNIGEKTSIKQQISAMDKCPTCLQDVDSVYRANITNKFESEITSHENEIEELKIKYSNVLAEIDELKQKINKKQGEISDLKLLKVKLESLKDKEERLMDISKTHEALLKDSEMIVKHIDLLKDSVREFEKYDSFYREKEKDLTSSLGLERQAHVKLAEIKKESDLIKKEIEELQNKIKEKEEIKQKLNYLIELEHWISDKFISLVSFTERNVLLKLREEFSRLFSQWFALLVSDNLTVTLDEDFTPVVEQQDFQLDYTFLSGGERTAIALAYRLALNQVINSMLSRIRTKDIVILDEPTDGFSEQQLDKVRDILSELNAKQIILVSHEQKVEGFVENIIRFHKEGGITKVEG